MRRLRGKVVSGLGNFGQWIERLGCFYEQKTGMRLYAGTLNIELPSEYSLPRDVIRLEAMSMAAGCRSTSFHATYSSAKHSCCGPIRMKKELDITRATSSRSPPMYGSAIITRSKTETGWKSKFHSFIGHVAFFRPLLEFTVAPEGITGRERRLYIVIGDRLDSALWTVRLEVRQERSQRRQRPAESNL